MPNKCQILILKGLFMKKNVVLVVLSLTFPFPSLFR